MATKEELIAVVKGDIKDFQTKMKQVSNTLHSSTGLVDRYGNTIEKTNTKAAQSTTKATKSFNTMGMSLSKLGGYALAAYGAFKTGETIIRSSANASDKLDVALGKISGGFQEIFRSVANLDFKNFFSDIEEAIRLGGELAERRDELQDSTRSLTIREKEYQSKIAASRLLASQENEPLQVRIDAMREAIRLQKELFTLQLKNGKEGFNIAMDQITSETKLSKEQLQNFLYYYNNQQSLREEAKKYLEDINNIVFAWGDKSQNARMQAKVDDLNAKTSDSVKVYAEIMTKYGDTSDKVIDEAIQKWGWLLDIISQNDQTLKGFNRQLNGLTPSVKPAGEKDRFPAMEKMGAFQAIPFKPEDISPLTAGVEKLTVAWKQFGDTVERTDIAGKFKNISQISIDIGKELKYLATDALVALADGLGEAFATGDFEAGAQKMLIAVADWAQKFGAMLIAAGLASEAFQKSLAASPEVAIASGVALIAAASLAKASMNRRPGASAQNGNRGGGGDFDLSGFRNLRSDFVVEVTGTLTGKGKDLAAVIQNESVRKSF